MIRCPCAIRRWRRSLGRASTGRRGRKPTRHRHSTSSSTSATWRRAACRPEYPTIVRTACRSVASRRNRDGSRNDTERTGTFNVPVRFFCCVPAAFSLCRAGNTGSACVPHLRGSDSEAGASAWVTMRKAASGRFRSHLRRRTCDCVPDPPIGSGSRAGAFFQVSSVPGRMRIDADTEKKSGSL